LRRADGASKGLPVILSGAQRNIIRQVYGSHDRELLIQDPALASYLALIHTCGIQARARFRPKLNVVPGKATRNNFSKTYPATNCKGFA
jgi:hypothetical protein